MVNRLKTEQHTGTINKQKAESTAIKAFGFLAREPEYFAVFSTQTGLAVDELAGMLDTPEFLIAVLEFMLSDDAMLLTFCQNSAEAPENVNFALLTLGKNHDFSANT